MRLSKKSNAIVLAGALILSLIILLSLNLSYFAIGSSNQKTSELIINPLRFNVYISKEASKLIDVESIKKVTYVEIFESYIYEIKDWSIVILDVKEISSNPLKILDILQNLNVNRLVILWININKDTEKAKDALAVYLKALSSKNIVPILPLDSNSIGEDKKQAPKVHSKIYSSKIFGFSLNPLGSIVIEDFQNIVEDLVIIQGWIEDRIKELTPAYIKDISNFNFIGFIGWKTTNFIGRGCGEITGYMAVKVDYYYTEVRTSQATYKTFLAHTQHSAKGYRTSCWFITWNHYPKIFTSTTDWKTSTWPGQILDDWGPKNMGTAATIEFTIRAGVSVGYRTAYATIEYSSSLIEPNSPYFEWRDLSDPHLGVASSYHELKLPSGYDESKLNNVLFTVEPSSIVFLDPNRPGGFLPMVISHYFSTTLNTGDSTTIQFSAFLYPDRVIEN